MTRPARRNAGRAAQSGVQANRVLGTDVRDSARDCRARRHRFGDPDAPSLCHVHQISYRDSITTRPAPPVFEGQARRGSPNGAVHLVRARRDSPTATAPGVVSRLAHMVESLEIGIGSCPAASRSPNLSKVSGADPNRNNVTTAACALVTASSWSLRLNVVRMVDGGFTPRCG